MPEDAGERGGGGCIFGRDVKLWRFCSYGKAKFDKNTIINLLTRSVMEIYLFAYKHFAVTQELCKSMLYACLFCVFG